MEPQSPHAVKVAAFARAGALRGAVFNARVLTSAGTPEITECLYEAVTPHHQAFGVVGTGAGIGVGAGGLNGQCCVL